MINIKRFLQGAGLGIIILTSFLFTKGYFLKRAKANLGPGMYGCGIRVNPVREDAPSAANNWTYSTTFKIFNDDNPDGSWTFEFWKCVCPEGAGQTGGECLRCEKSQETIALKHGEANAVERTISANQLNGNGCGSFQFDVEIIDGSVRGCVDFQGGHYGPVWGLWHSFIDCIPTLTPTPTPTEGLTPTPTPTPTEGLTPTPTPTPPSTRGCWQVCGHDNECDSGLSCQQIDDTKRCVKSECNREQDCNCAGPTPTPPQVLGEAAPKVLPAAGIEDLSEILLIKLGAFGALLSLIGILL